MSYSLLKRLLFSIDAETAHNFAMWALSRGLVSGDRIDEPSLRTSLFGKPIPHPLGLAAGFDKNALAIDQWETLGFAFVEVGTVTPVPQEGNARPRLFRLPQDEAIINRMGFNNDGAREVANRLEARETKIPVGVNIGKNKWTPNENAIEDYAMCFDAVRDVCDYVVVNVSSPNTPGLRDLQSVESVARICDRLKAISLTPPILFKLSPDSADEEIAEVSRTAVEHGAHGIVATNTTLAREGVSTPIEQEGGLSGKPLEKRAREVCGLARTALDDGPTIIGVGGISSGSDARERLKAGANLIQIYTSFVYRGPNAASLILREMQAAEE